jgi:hypothetical protein
VETIKIMGEEGLFLFGNQPKCVQQQQEFKKKSIPSLYHLELQGTKVFPDCTESVKKRFEQFSCQLPDQK